MENKSAGFFQGISPKFMFVFGLLIGFSIISTVAFFVVLFANMNGVVEAADSGSQAVANTDTAPEAEVAAPINVAAIDLSDVYIRGDEDAPVTIVEYSDFECPYCSKFHETMNQIMADYDGQIRWIWKHYPLSFHANAESSATAVECAGEQGKFWEYADALYTNQTSLGADLYPELASDLGLNVSTFNTCVATDKFQDLFIADLDEGTSIGVNGTPGNVVFATGASTGELIAGAYPYEYVAGVIDSLL